MNDKPLEPRKKTGFSIPEDHLSLDKKQGYVKKNEEFPPSEKAVCKVKKFYKKIKDRDSFEQESNKTGFDSRIPNDILESGKLTQEGGTCSKRSESEARENDQVMLKPTILTDPDHFETATVKHATPEPEIDQMKDEQRIFPDPDRCEGATDEHSSANITNSDSIFMETSVSVPGPSKNSDRKKNYNCKHCRNYKTSQYSKFKIHLRTHTGEKPFVCSTCNKGFSTKGNLVVHIRSHTGEKPYVCKICNKGYITSSKLRVHIRLHTGEKPYVCKTCNKGFSANTHLRSHISFYTGKEPYVCEICNKKFHLNSRLKIHIRFHTGERPYLCEICGKAFISSSHKKRHERTHKRTNSNE